MPDQNLVFHEETYKIIGACMEVHSTLGHGFLEAVYGDALMIEFEDRRIEFEREVSFEITYKGLILDHGYCADFEVEGKIILEIKAAKELASEHVAQTLNYLKASGRRVGLLVNFGRESLEYKRLIY